MPESMGVNAFFDKFFMDEQGSGLSGSGPKNDAYEWNENAKRRVKIAEEDTSLSLDQIKWKNALQSEFESDLGLKTYNFFIN